MSDRPSKEELRVIAAVEPRVAFALARGCQIESQSMELRFVSGAPGQPIDNAFPQVDHPIYGFDLNYSVSQPEYLLGSSARGQQVFYNALQPDIKVAVRVSQGWGPSNWMLNVEQQQIDGIFRHTSKAEGGCCSWTKGALLYPWQRMTVTAVLARSYAGEGEVPVIVNCGLRYAYLGPYARISVDDAVSGLAGLGFNQFELPQAGELGEIKSLLAGFDRQLQASRRG